MDMPVPPSSDLALTETYPPIKFTTLPKLTATVSSAREDLINGKDENQYLSFNHVTQKDFERIEQHRAKLGHIRFTHFADIETLIIKIPSEPHEKAHLSLGQICSNCAFQMQLNIREFCPIGGTLYRSQRSSKEGDSSYKNLMVRSNSGDWPSFVIEAGLSELLQRLRCDAQWWISHSGGQVRIVLLIKVNKAHKHVMIEKWVPRQQPTTRTSPRFARPLHPTKITTITIDQSGTPAVIAGAPLTLEFNEIFSRPAIPPVEKDIVFTRQDLDTWAKAIWLGL